MTRPGETAAAGSPVHEPPSTKEGWTAFVQQQPSRVDLLSAQQLEALTPAERDAYDEKRVAHHARLVVVATPTVDQIVKTGRRLVVLNSGTDTARRGLVVTGDSGTGKSTAIKQLGKHHELLTRRRRGTTAPLMPVIYITVPPAATPKILAAEFAGVRGRQIAGRFASIATTPFAFGTRTQRDQWAALVSALENALRLHHHRPGALVRLASYLHARTSGMIGSLSHLIRDAAIEAIFDGTERITKNTLESVILDHAAEHPRIKTPPAVTRPRRSVSPIDSGAA